MYLYNTDDTINTDNTDWSGVMFVINLQGKNSIYEQIRDQILRYIELGVLQSNDKLPSVRQLALELGINPNTVQKAYQELESQGYIYTLPKKGAFIAEGNKENKKDHLLEEISLLFTQAKEANISKEEIILTLEEIYKEV